MGVIERVRTMKHLTEHQKLDWIGFAIKEAINGNETELEQALELVEELQEKVVERESET